MSHGTLFELEAVAQTAQISLAWGITIRQNRGDTTAREPRTYHGRGFLLKWLCGQQFSVAQFLVS
jgi:hypothetical protein